MLVAPVSENETAKCATLPGDSMSGAAGPLSLGRVVDRTVLSVSRCPCGS